MKKIGLTLGKYAPLHAGHMHVFETALQEVDELYVLIYQSSITSIPLNIRAQWIRDLFPQIHVIEAWDGPEGYSNDRAFEIEQENYIIQKLNGVKISHFYSSEFYGEHVSTALNAIDRRVDESRLQVPISATMIRANAFQNRKFIPNCVYADLISKVVFVGAMSTGKSTLLKRLRKSMQQLLPQNMGVNIGKLTKLIVVSVLKISILLQIVISPMKIRSL